MSTRNGAIAVIGGGINGAGVAWELTRRDYDVTLFEKGRCGEQTSSRTTKMIHGGLRYLERGHVRLVRESLRDRAWLLAHLPQLVRPLEILLPLYEDSPRTRLTVRTGLILYDLLSGRQNIRRHQSWSASEMRAEFPLRAEGLKGGFSYWDAQVDDYRLVRTVVASAARDGAQIREQTPVQALRRDGGGWIVVAAGEERRFNVVVNAAGPWMNEWLARNRIRASYILSLVRGSHLVLRQRLSDSGLLLQSTGDRRVFFVLPWKEGTLVGTTEVVHRQPLEEVRPSEEEIDYLVKRFNRYMAEPIGPEDIAATFAGVRPLVGRSTNPGAIGRDYRIVRQESLINVFGGKLTTFMSLARKVGMRVDNHFGTPRVAKEPVFETAVDSAPVA